jgi:pulcherriminic acid synthase
VEAERIDNHAEPIARRLAGELANAPTGDLARDFAGRLPLELLAAVLDIPSPDQARFFDRYWRAQRGVSWQPVLHDDGKRALQELVDYFAPLLEARRRNPGEDLISAMADLAVDGKPVGASDVVVTLLERDHETLHGALANLWYLLLTHPDEYAKARSERRLMKLAYLETLRHSPPVLSAERFARHEVERFGRLLPEGALLVCSAAAANRDPRVFSEPDRFIVDRKDLCQREARGQYRADGLASGIAFRLGKPSVHPAVPEDRPRSRYAITRDTAVTASMVLLDAFDDISLAPGARPGLSALTVGEMHTCWQLPVTLRPH